MSTEFDGKATKESVKPERSTAEQLPYFDRTAPGEGVEVLCKLENGKALLEWKLHYENYNPGQGCFLRLRLLNREGEAVLECLQRAEEEERLRSVLLHSQLWQGVEKPYRYTLEAILLTAEGKRIDTCVRSLPLYVLEQDSGKGFLLNGESFCPKTVHYRIPQCSDTVEWKEALLKDIRLIGELGANVIYLEEAIESAFIENTFLQLCEEAGLLVRQKGQTLPEPVEKMPLFRGEGGLLRENGECTSLYYKFRAKWSKKPFVYPVPESIKQQENGNFTVTVYSSCKKVALYVDGVLQAFLSGREEFVFRDIAAAGPCLVLTAEAEECARALSIPKTFIKALPFWGK